MVCWGPGIVHKCIGNHLRGVAWGRGQLEDTHRVRMDLLQLLFCEAYEATDLAADECLDQLGAVAASRSEVAIARDIQPSLQSPTKQTAKADAS